MRLISIQVGRVVARLAKFFGSCRHRQLVRFVGDEPWFGLTDKVTIRFLGERVVCPEKLCLLANT